MEAKSHVKLKNKIDYGGRWSEDLLIIQIWFEKLKM